MPELRGQLISGRIVPQKEYSLFQEEKIALSIPGNRFLLKLAKINNRGEFYFNLNQAYESREGFVQILGRNRENYTIEINEDVTLEYKKTQIWKTEHNSRNERDDS